MDIERIHEIARQRIAASQVQAVRGLVRTNAMLSDEIEMLQAEVRRLQAIVHTGTVSESPGDTLACEGCAWWKEWDQYDICPCCGNETTPEPWRSAAANGGLSGCPNYAPSCRYLEPGSEPFAALSDGIPLYPAYDLPRPGENYRRRMGWWDGATGEWVGVTLDGRLFRQRQLWGNDVPRPDKWEKFRLGYR